MRDPEGSWAPVVTTIAHNVIFANYGGSQGVDNDDGSAWYDIHHNFFYGEGLKMDYGGASGRASFRGTSRRRRGCAGTLTRAPVPTEVPRRGRGVAATRLHGRPRLDVSR